MSVMSNYHKKIIFFLLMLGLAVRLFSLFFYFRYNPLMLSFDSGHYHQTALSLLSTGSFSDAAGAPYFYRLPGYPFFIACCYTLFGVNPVVVLCIQNILSLAVPLALYFLTIQLFPEYLAAAFIAFTLALFHPGYIIYANLLMSELLFLLLFLCFIFLFQEALLSNKKQGDSSGYRSFFMAGIFLGLASLVRPIGHIIFITALFLSAISFFKDFYFSQKRLFAQFFSLSTGWLLIVSGWLVRNYLLTGSLFFHTLSGAHFVNHVAIKATMHEYTISYDEARNLCYQEINKIRAAEKKRLHAHELHSYQEALLAEGYAKKVMLRNSFYSVRLFIENIIKTVLGLYSSELLVIASGGQLPPYEPHSSLISRAARYLFPQGSPIISCIIWYEIALWLLLLLTTCFVLLNFARIFLIKKFKIITEAKSEKSKKNSLEMSLFFEQAVIAFVCIVLSFGCGFARLRLPSEYFFIMVTSVFIAEKISKKGGSCGEQK